MSDLAALTPTVQHNAELAQSRVELAKRNLRNSELSKVDAAAQDFEAVFLSQMMENMFADIDFDPTSDGPGDDIYKSMMISEYGKIVAKSGGIGVADHVKKAMLQSQEIK